MSARPVLVVGAVLALVSLPVAANATWLSTGAATGLVRADVVPPAPGPHAVDDDSSVHLDWAAVAMGDGTAVDAYEVRRWSAGGGEDVPACDGPVTTTSCTDGLVPEGRWRYSLVARTGGRWVGPEGAPSAEVEVVWPRVHVADLDGAAQWAGGNQPWTAIASVTVRDQDGSPVPDVDVEGVWKSATEPAAVGDVCTTGADGTCEVVAEAMPTGGGGGGPGGRGPGGGRGGAGVGQSATFTVDRLARPGHVHDGAGDVHTAVTVTRNGDVTPQ